MIFVNSQNNLDARSVHQSGGISSVKYLFCIVYNEVKCWWANGLRWLPWCRPHTGPGWSAGSLSGLSTGDSLQANWHTLLIITSQQSSPTSPAKCTGGSSSLDGFTGLTGQEVFSGHALISPNMLQGSDISWWFSLLLADVPFFFFAHCCQSHLP